MSLKRRRSWHQKAYQINAFKWDVKGWILSPPGLTLSSGPCDASHLPWHFAAVPWWQKNGAWYEPCSEGNPGTQRAAVASKLVPAWAARNEGTRSLMWTASHLQFRFCPDQMDIRHKTVLSHVTQEKKHLAKTIKQNKNSLVIPIKNASGLCVFKEKKRLYKALQGAMSHFYEM